MKEHLSTTFLLSIGGGILGFFIVSSLFSKPEANILRNISEPSAEEILVSKLPILSGKPDLWEKISADYALIFVGIQVFLNDKMARQGSGVILSSDGLIITTADLLVVGGVYQIFYGGEIYKGTVLARDFDLNLMIIKTIANYPSVVNIGNNYDYNSGREILLVGKLTDLSEPIIFSQRGVISHKTKSSIYIDTTPNYYLSGSGIIDSAGRFIGISYLRNGGVRLINIQDIDTFFKDQIDKIKQ